MLLAKTNKTQNKAANHGAKGAPGLAALRFARRWLRHYVSKLTMKSILLPLLLFSVSSYGSDIKIEIEKEAAKLSHCSEDRPCIIAVELKEDRYMVTVTKSASITDYGVLTFITPAVVYYEFDINGTLSKVMPTP